MIKIYYATEENAFEQDVREVESLNYAKKLVKEEIQETLDTCDYSWDDVEKNKEDTQFILWGDYKEIWIITTDEHEEHLAEQEIGELNEEFMEHFED